MDARARVLDGLLGSIADDLGRVAALDVTPDGAGAASLRRRETACDTEPRPGCRYGLVLCHPDALDRVGSYVEHDGSVLVYVAKGEPRIVMQGLTEVARVRTRDGQWHLLRLLEAQPRPRPAVSVVVSSQDQASELARLVMALVTEPEQPSWELVVVDRGSFDATAELLRHVSGDLQAIRVRRVVHPAEALHLGMCRARGDLIAVFDPDLQPQPGFIAGLMQAADADPDADVFAGPVFERDGTTPAQEDGGPVRLLAVRRRVVHRDGPIPAAALAIRLRLAQQADAIGFRASRTPPRPAPDDIAPDDIAPAVVAPAV